MPCRVEAIANRIRVTGSIALPDLRRIGAAFHNLTSKQGYQDLVIDLEACYAAFPGPMVGLCAIARESHSKGVGIELVRPRDERFASLVRGASWAHLIDPKNYRPSQYKGYTHVPAATYATHDEQPTIVNRMIDALLCAAPGMERADLGAIEWSLNEVTDNVLVHSGSALGGIASLNNYKAKHLVEFVVADSGAGIPNTLRRRFPNLEDFQLLERAIREGVTSDPTLGQGNGLFGTFQVARVSGGYLYIHSGYAALGYDRGQLRLDRESIPFPGTLVVAAMDCSTPAALGEALRFGGTKYEPSTYVETHFEDRASDELVFRMHEETISCGSRVAGTAVRNKLANLIYMNPGRRVHVDMSEIPIVSSSFADEVFGKLFVSLGPVSFMARVSFRGVSTTVQALVDRAIMQRSHSG